MNFPPLTVPNLLSFSRIVLAFGTAVSLFCGSAASAIIFMIAAGITDFFDGYAARKFNMVSQFGACLDPLADKILMFVTYVSMAVMNMIPAYAAWIVIFRDIIILFGVSLCFYYKTPLKMAPLMSSKINTAVQISYLVFVLACNCFHLHITFLMSVFTWAVVVTTVWSGAEYVQKYRWIAGLIHK